MLKRYSLKRQFILTFAFVLVCSILSVIATVMIGLLLIDGKNIKQANYYEKMIPEIELYINHNNIKLLDKDYENELDKLIPPKGIKYKVINLESENSYGNLDNNLDNKLDKKKINR